MINQQPKIIDRLRETGAVSRNWCLSKGITRLGSIINDLVAVGYTFDSHQSKTGKCMMHGKWVKERHTRDYVYVLKSFPKK